MLRSELSRLRRRSCWGVLQAVMLAKFRNCSRVIIEGDNKTVMENLHERGRCPTWRLLPLFTEIVDSLDKFTSISFSWLSRNANFEAHAFCKWATKDRVSGFVSMGDLPHLVHEAFDRAVV